MDKTRVYIGPRERVHHHYQFHFMLRKKKNPGNELNAGEKQRVSVLKALLRPL